MDVKTATDVGQVRDNNEDALWVSSQCLVVCDGMGGHLAGEIASDLAIKAIRIYPFSGQDPELEVCLAIEEAQKQVLFAAQGRQEYQGMGTTITLAWFTPSPDQKGVRITLGHVGDSRCYVFADGVLEQLSSDHSIVGELVRSGTITPLEARTHPKRHMLTQALGTPEVEIEILSKELTSGSLVVLCTDGLTDVVDDQLLIQTLSQGFEATDLAQDLVRLANELGGPDNVTVIVAQV